MRATLTATVLIASTTIGLATCAPVMRSSLDRPPTEAELAELWSPPADVAALDLYFGPGGEKLAPDPDAEYTLIAKDTSGYSDGYDVYDPQGLEWSVKVGEEAQTEVVASRLFWAAGYHQPPTYFLPKWTLAGGDEPGEKGAARFRPKVAWLDKTDEWAWHHNPFVGTQPFRGLIVLNLMINNADLRTPNNVIYELPEAREGARRWYVVRDLGGSFGATGFIYGTRNDIEGFESQTLVKRNGEGIEFDYHGRHRELLEGLTAADLVWAAGRWAELTTSQWSEAFRAAGYTPAVAGRYIRKLQQKMAEAMAPTADQTNRARDERP
jgi:hypothetical protein